MEFDLLDGYLLDGSPPKAEVIRRLLESPPSPRAAPFYEGMRILGARTPDLSLMALRLVLAGKKAGDDEVKALRAIVDRARSGDAEARQAYRTLFDNV